MTHSWIETEDQFAWAFDFFIRAYASNFIEPIPRPSDEAIRHAAGRIVAIDQAVFGRVIHRSLTKETRGSSVRTMQTAFLREREQADRLLFLTYLLLMNGLKLRAGLRRRADLLKWIAESDPKRREQVIRSIVRFLRSEIEPIPDRALARHGFTRKPPSVKS